MALTADYPARLTCRATGWPRSSLYRRAEPPADEGRLRQALARLAGEWPAYGYRRLTALLRREGWRVNGKRVRRVMAELGIRGKAPPRRVRTTDGAHALPRDPNRVAGLEVVRPGQVWVADITHVRLRREFVYLAVLTGAQSQAEVCRQHGLKPELVALWKKTSNDRLPLAFAGDARGGQDAARVAELERLVGRLTLELEVAKKASALLPSALGLSLIHI